MATYLILNVFFTLVVVAILIIGKALKINKAVVFTFIILLVATAIFDSIIINAGIVDYDYSLLSGIVIGVAPIEDFMYAAVAVLLIPSLWHFLEKKRVNES